MRRRSWTLGVQAGLLAGVGLALVGGSELRRAEAAPICQSEGLCTFRKPLFLVMVDSSTAMNQAFMPGKTRWQAAVEALTAAINDQNGYLQGNVILGLMRFGHDPNVGATGTTIAGDTSVPPLVDGQAIDLPFYDSNAPNKDYYHCNGEALKASIAEQKPPLNGAPVGIGAWTRGALLRAEGYVAQTIADHPQEMEPRRAALIVLTQGAWTDPTGAMVMQPAGEDPAAVAATLFTDKAIPTYVMAFGDADGVAAAHALAAAGGTGQATAGGDVMGFVVELQTLVEDIKQNTPWPNCVPDAPRLMVLLDASSKMLNVMGGTVAGEMGETSWDRARAMLAGDAGIFEHTLGNMHKIEDLVYLGLAVFGDAKPKQGEQAIVIDYTPCRQKNVAWALDPKSSCVPPGCVDPWGGPPITWTFQDGAQIKPPGLDLPTISHMPRCDAGGPFPLACSGSGAQLHLGLDLVQKNIAAHKAKCQAPGYTYPCDAETKFVNLLVTDGNDESDAAQVQGPLEEMYAAGVTTYVLGVGEAPNVLRLQALAGWGSGGQEGYFAASDQLALQQALEAVIESIPYDPCCSFNICDKQVCDGCWDPFCGDAMVNGGEQCDDGNYVPGDGCESDCTLTPAVCGNGNIEPPETCDDGNQNPGDGCEPNCTPTPVCGDGKLQGDEECDDGNDVPGDGCGPDCTQVGVDPVCGDGFVGLGEACDDGNDVPGDGCEPDCALTPSGAGTSSSGEVVTTGEVSTSSGSGSEGGGTTGGASSGEMVVGGGDGCGCAADGGGPRGVLAVVLALGCVGRRGRRREERA